MQLVYFTEIFEDNRNIVRDFFVTDTENVMKNRPLVAKKDIEISVYINLAQSHQKTIEIKNNTQNIGKPYWCVTNY